MSNFNKYQLFLELILLTEIEFNKINTKGDLKIDMNLHEKLTYDYMNVLSVNLPENWDDDTHLCSHVAILLMIMVDLNVEPFFCFDLPDNINLLVDLIKTDYKNGETYFRDFNAKYGSFVNYVKTGKPAKAIKDEYELILLNAAITAMTLYKLQYTHKIDVNSSHFISKLLDGDAHYWQLFIFNTGEEFIPVFETISPSILSLPIKLHSNKNTKRQVFTIDTLKELCREKMASVITEVTASAPPIENMKDIPIATAVCI